VRPSPVGARDSVRRGIDNDEELPDRPGEPGEFTGDGGECLGTANGTCQVAVACVEADVGSPGQSGELGRQAITPGTLTVRTRVRRIVYGLESDEALARSRAGSDINHQEGAIVRFRQFRNGGPCLFGEDLILLPTR